MNNIVLALFTWTVSLIYRLFFVVTGLFLQPFAIIFSKTDRSDESQFTQYPEHGKWYHVTAPKWLYPWGNARDGFLGDKRGWWANERGGKQESFLSQYLWSAVRNPCNNLRFMPFSSCNVSKADIKLLAGDYQVSDDIGMDGWQFVKATENGIPYYGFRLMKPWKKDSTKALYIWLGYKVEPRHKEQYPTPIDDPYGKQMKGLTFRVSFNKDIS